MARALTLALGLLGCGSGHVPSVTRQTPDARVTVMDRGDTVQVDIASTRGIGRATLEREGRWPGALILRLHLKGLEGLELMAGTDTVRVSRPSSDGPPAAGWYEVPVPASLLEGHQALEVAWVDFYR